MSLDDAYIRRDRAYDAMVKASEKASDIRTASKEHQEVMYPNGTDVQYRSIPSATDEAVWSANKEAYEAQKRYEAAQRDVDNLTLSPEEVAKLREERRQQELAKKEQEAYEHKMAFETVRQIYKKQSRWNRFMNLIQGKKPDWNKVEEYTTEELQFLDTLSRGRSVWQEKINQERWERREKNGMSSKEMRKLENEKNMKDFLKGLNSDSTLRSDLSYEKSSRGIK